MWRTEKFILASILMVSVFFGCAQMREDYQRGKDTPYTEGETTVEQQTGALANTVSGIPYANVSAPLIMFVGPYIFAWLRGRRLRKKTLTIHPDPITGTFGQTIGAETLIQHVANVAAGLFEVGPSGSSLKRGWKMALISGLGIAFAPYAQDMISNTILPILQTSPPTWLPAFALTGTIAAFAAAEKWLSKVQPVAPSPSN